MASRNREGRRARDDDDRSPPAGTTTVADLKVVEFGLERLDRAVGHLEVLVETIALRNEL